MTPALVSDADLARRIAGCAAGEATREEGELYERFARRVYLYGLRHLRDESQAADLAQEVMALVIQKLRAGEVWDPGRIGSFILGTARMLARDERRRARRRAERDERMAAGASEVCLPVEPLPLQRVAACLQRLDERERSILVMSFAAERSATEIADDLGLSPSHVRVVRHRALKRLQACVAGGNEEAGA